MKSRYRLTAFAAFFVLMSFATVQACGPDFSPDIFVHVNHPDDSQAFAAGELGILQTGFDSNDYAVAYRYLIGGKLSPAERRAYAPPTQPPMDWSRMTPAQQRAAEAAQQKAYQEGKPGYSWRQALEKYAPQSHAAADNHRPTQPWLNNSLYYDPGYANCPRPAFQTAALTLANRAKTWGRQSEWLANWVSAQEAVFSNCMLKKQNMPQPAPPGSPKLLRADRAYQNAAADFYAGKYDQAQKEFEAIAADSASPWHVWGGFLAARAEVRASFAAGPKTDPWSGERAGFDMPMMRRAQQMLENLLAHPVPGLPQRVVVQELHFVQMRTEPDKRISEVCAALAGPAPDSNFAQDLKDLSYVLLKQIDIHNPPPLYRWIAMLRTGTPVAAYLAWKQTPAMPWLVVALMKALPGDSSTPELLQAASHVSRNSPAWPTVMFERVRLLTGRGNKSEARHLLDGFLPAMRRQPANSALNAFLGERMVLARTFDEFLEYAPRTVLETSSEGAFYQQQSCPPTPGNPNLAQNCLASHPMEFDRDAVSILNRTPLSLLVQAATSPRLPANLREEIAAAAWTRSVVLHDSASAARLVPLLSPALHVSVSDGVGFRSILIILRNPGLRPYVETGVSHLNRPGKLDIFRDNWWCNDWEPFPHATTAPQPPAFLTPREAQTGEAEFSGVLALPCAPQFLGNSVLNYAVAHPADPDVPEALALAVRATHYACLSWKPDQEKASRGNTAISKAAFEMLHRRYPKSAWTRRTRYYY